MPAETILVPQDYTLEPVLAFAAAIHQPHKKQAEIGILDVGVGIRNSLSKNPHLTLESDRDALNLALMPGISGKMFKGVVRNAYDYDPWQNSGYGLYAVSRLCGLGGKFLIGSGDAALSLKPEEKKIPPHPAPGRSAAAQPLLQRHQNPQDRP